MNAPRASSHLLRNARLAGLESGTDRRSVVEFLGSPDGPQEDGEQNDLSWGDLTVVFHDDVVIYSQVSCDHDLRLSLPQPMAEADAIRGVPRDFSALVEQLHSHGVDYVLDESQPAASGISTRSVHGKTQLIFLEDVLVKILFTWPNDDWDLLDTIAMGE